MDSESTNTELLTLTAEIVSSHVSNNSVAVSDLPILIGNVYASLSTLGIVPEADKAKQEPAVSIRSSIKPDYIVCLEDGKKLKMLKRHLMTSYGMTPDAYRLKWNLPADYPMVAPNYAERRRSLAIRIGLGNKRVAAIEPMPVEPPTGRKSRKAGSTNGTGKPPGSRKTAGADAG